jgi:CRP-like cAMP-binding protein
MDLGPILANVARIIAINEEEEQIFASLLEPWHAKRKDVLLEPGQVCQTSWFVQAGCLRSYTLTEDGEEHVLSFAPVGWWIADMYSLISGRPAVLTIQAIEEAEGWHLTKENQEKLFVAVPKFERFFRILVERSLVAYQQRVLDATSLSAEDRYKKFCRYYPTLIDTLPQKQIASFIGVTPEFYSKMRSRILREK